MNMTSHKCQAKILSKVVNLNEMLSTFKRSWCFQEFKWTTSLFGWILCLIIISNQSLKRLEINMNWFYLRDCRVDWVKGYMASALDMLHLITYSCSTFLVGHVAQNPLLDNVGDRERNTFFFFPFWEKTKQYNEHKRNESSIKSLLDNANFFVLFCVVTLLDGCARQSRRQVVGLRQQKA